MPATPVSYISSRDTLENPDYAHPAKRGPEAAVVLGILGVVATVVVVARFRSRFFLQRNHGIDDWVFLLAMPSAAAAIISFALATTKYDYNMHQWDIPADAGAAMKMIMLASCVNYVISTCGIKTSVLLFYKRLTSGKISALYTWTVRIAIAFQILFLVSCVGILCTPCRPVQSYWLRMSAVWLQTHEYSCLNEESALMGMGIVSVVQDLVATLVPFHMISQMQLPRRQKIALYATFGGGLLVSAVGLLRVLVVCYIKYQHAEDLPWWWYFYALVSGAEVALATICASLPALKFYFRTYLDPEASPNPNVIFLADSELSDYTDYSSYTTTGDAQKVVLKTADDIRTKVAEVQVRPAAHRHVTSVEALDGMELVRSGIIREEVLKYDSTHVRGLVTPLSDAGHLIDD